MNFPIFKTKIPGLTRKFDLADPRQRQEYFQAKAGEEMKKIRNYLDSGNTFIAYLLGKKNAGKGTYAKLFIEALNTDRVEHLSVGDIVRDVDKKIKDKKEKEELIDYLKANYRGFLSLKQVIDAQLNRSTRSLLPTEFVLALIRREIDKKGRKALFLDGFPRDLDQVSYSLFFRNLIDYRPDPDFFVLIDVPEAVIDERLKYRVVCPKCQTPRNLKVHVTKKVGFDPKTKAFYLVCDNPACRSVRMVAKEGDELGITVIKDRLEKDDFLLKRAFSLYGIPKVVLRNSIPVEQAKKFVDDYEITPEYVYHWGKQSKEVKVSQKLWVINDDADVPSHSLLPPPVVVSLLKQVADLL